MNLNTTILAWQSYHQSIRVLTNRGISSRQQICIGEVHPTGTHSSPLWARDQEVIGMLWVGPMILSILENNQSSSKPHINKDLCHLKQPYLSTCEKVWTWTSWTHQKFHLYFEHPYKHSTTKKASQHSNAARVLWAMWPDLWREHSTAPQWGRLSPAKDTTFSYMASPWAADENIPTWKDRRPPFLWNSWRRTIKTHTVKNSEINETFASEKWGRQRISIGIGHGTDGERSLKEASDLFAHVLQLINQAEEPWWRNS